VVSLGEGATPLVHARRLGGSIGVPNLYLKIEGKNPTGSFRDRGMVMAIAKALESGARSVICASTGNTSASAAAYAAAAELECVVVLPAGKIATGKLVSGLPDQRTLCGKGLASAARRPFKFKRPAAVPCPRGSECGRVRRRSRGSTAEPASVARRRACSPGTGGARAAATRVSGQGGGA
jgi:hypothetical protein